MGLGLAKDFVIFLFIAIIVWAATENWQTGLGVLGLYAIVKVVWSLLTK